MVPQRYASKLSTLNRVNIHFPRILLCVFMMDNPEGNETWKDFSRQAAFAISKHPNGDFDETVAFYLDNDDLHDDYMVSY